MAFGSISVDKITDSEGSVFSPSSALFRNRIINGDMRIDQRNAGAAVTSNNSYPVDRFFVPFDTDGAFSAQQDSSAPAGFVNSLKFTTTTADATIGATQYAMVRQVIEGLNVADLGWGTASAKTVTLSFWVRSSLTGTFGGSLQNNAEDRSYPFSYTISSADTWEQKTITVAGDTTGTWLTTNGRGIRLAWGLGVGSTYSGTAGAWSATPSLYSVTGAVSVIGTLNATWFITGVQLEVGSVATPFERRPYGAELALCQRYFIAYTNTVFGGTNNRIATGAGGSTTLVRFSFPFPTAMRAAPSVTMSGTPRAEAGSAISITSASAAGMTAYSAGVDANAASGLTAGTAYAMDTGSGGYSFSAEL
jgi:hypothetical protein